MEDKSLGRREFLKLALASATAAGLSHFQVLNFGADVALADPPPPDPCTSGAVPDFCDPVEPDGDVCPDPNANSSDVCIPPQEADYCEPPDDPDICDPADAVPDECKPDEGDPDDCEVPPGGADTCGPGVENPDICPDGPSGDGDICRETNPGANPDECIPAVDESDGCTASAEPDFCRNPDSGQVEHDICAEPDPDICWENNQNVVDECNPASDPDDPDTDPNAITLNEFSARSSTDRTTLALAAAGGATALTATAVWIRQRLRPDETEDE